jgi:hypothetical protein
MKSIGPIVRSLVEQFLTGAKAPVGHALQKAMEHGEAAYREMKSLPDRAADPDRHDRCVRDAYAHVKACERYLDNYRSFPPEPAETPAIALPADPAAAKAREAVRAFAAVTLAGFGRDTAAPS